MLEPSVVVGIATQNRADILQKAISSALAQSYRPLRVAVIDDGSTDQTSTLREQFAEVSWERWDHSEGYVKARNRMMLSAGEDYYVSLDDDAWFVDDDEIAIAIGFMESNPSVAAVAFDILYKDRPEKNSGVTTTAPGHSSAADTHCAYPSSSRSAGMPNSLVPMAARRRTFACALSMPDMKLSCCPASMSGMITLLSAVI